MLSKMRLFEADCHLEYVRLRLAQRQNAKARPHLADAATLITETGYHRRDPDLAELSKKLEDDNGPAPAGNS